MKKRSLLILLVSAIIFTAVTVFMFINVLETSETILGIIIFVAFDLILWGIFISQSIKITKIKRIMKTGKEYTATFLSYSSNIEVNEVPMYNITYFWKSNIGEYKEGKSLNIYNIQEAIAFKKAEQFKIKVLGNDSIIISKPAQMEIEQHELIENIENDVVCEYCNTGYSSKENKCPHCGAYRIKK